MIVEVDENEIEEDFGGDGAGKVCLWKMKSIIMMMNGFLVLKFVFSLFYENFILKLV